MCLIDPVGDVYACPFAIHDAFLAGNVREPRRLHRRCGAESSCSASCASRRPAAPCESCSLRLLPRRLHGGEVLHRAAARRPRPRVRAGPRRGRCSARASTGAQPRPRRRRRTTRKPPALAGPTDAPATRARSPASTCVSAWSRTPMAQHREWFETVAEAQRAGQAGACPVGLRRAAGRLRGGRDARRQRRRVRRARLRPARRRPAGGTRELATTVLGPGDLAAGADLADRRAGRAPGRRGRGRPRGRGARHRDGAELVRQQADRGGRSRPTRRPSSRCTGWARATRDACRSSTAPAQAGRQGPDRHARLVVLAPARLGQPGDPRAARPQDDGRARAAGRCCKPRWLRDFARAGGLPDLTVPNMAAAGRRDADVLRRLRRVDADAAADLGRRRLAARRSGSGPFMRQGHHAPRRRARGRSTPGRPRSRSPTTAATTSTARRPRSARCRAIADAVGDQIEVAARRRHPPRDGRREGRRARRPRGHDRPRLPVGAGGQRPGGGRERPRDPARGHHGDAERDRRGLGGDLTPHDLVVPPGFARTPNHQSGSWLPAEP